MPVINKCVGGVELQKQGTYFTKDVEGNEQVLDLVLNVIPPKKKRNKSYKKGGFFLINQEKLTELLKNKETSKRLTGETLKLLLFYQSLVEYGNRIKGYTQIQMSEMTGMKQSQISRGTKELVSLDIIYKEGRDYYFNNDFLMKGDEAFE